LAKARAEEEEKIRKLDAAQKAREKALQLDSSKHSQEELEAAQRARAEEEERQRKEDSARRAREKALQVEKLKLEQEHQDTLARAQREEEEKKKGKMKLLDEPMKNLLLL